MSLCPSEPFSAPPSLFAVSQTQGPLWWTSFLCIPWGNSGAAHMCLITAFTWTSNPSNSNCLMLENPVAETCWVKVDVDLFIVHIESQFTANNLRLRHQSLSLTDFLVWKERKEAGLRQGHLFDTRPLCLISLQIGWLVCWLDWQGAFKTSLTWKTQHWCSNYELENSGNLLYPCGTHQLLQIAVLVPNLISDRVGRAGRHRRSTFAQTQAHHTSLSQLSRLVAFTARLENGAVKSMSETSALFLLDSLDPLILLQIRTLVHISQCGDLQPEENTQIRSAETTTLQRVSECLTVPAPHSCTPMKSDLCLPTKRLY